MKGIFHIHTKNSFDAHIPPSEIVKYIQSIGLDFAAITDHETIKGALECRDIARYVPTIIVGAEYWTDKGDIIGLFLEKDVTSKKSDEIIRQIKAQGGIVVLPHPCRSHKLDSKLISQVDVIEVFNARGSNEENNSALELAKKYNKPMLAGSDAHFLEELSLTEVTILGTDLKSAILRGELKITKQEQSTTSCRVRTGLIRLSKQKDPRIIIGWIKKLLEKM